jgi:acyl-coenzyme A synthetase/AMP-(fatty) acid ligase/aryl carrier-like protein
MREWLGITEHDRLLAVTTISFDIAGVDVWLPLVVGAQVIVASREAAVDGNELRRVLERHDVTFLQATPITWRQLLEAGWRGKSNLQAVCTGEAMPPDLAGTLVPLVPRVWNLYGPTETTIWSTGYRVENGKATFLMGRPIANTSCYILDEHRQPVPVGVVGELYIGGDGVARGYLNRPDLTGEKFLPDPFRAVPGVRMYRTGDLARFRANGDIECLGRTDHQVKIRGFRIELGEIEARLKQHADVRDAVVVAREDRAGEKRLVAYVVAASEKVPNASDLRAFIRQTLPDYMVPSAWVFLPALPLSPNGKIDRRALPAPQVGEETVDSAGPGVAPRTPLEVELTAIWRALLARPELGVTDNVFDFGAHSLLLMRALSRIRQSIDVDLQVRDLFESPTVESLACVITQRQLASAVGPDELERLLNDLDEE